MTRTADEIRIYKRDWLRRKNNYQGRNESLSDCLRCGTPIVPRSKAGLHTKKYCSRLCKRRDHATRSWKPEYGKRYSSSARGAARNALRQLLQRSGLRIADAPDWATTVYAQCRVLERQSKGDIQ